MADAEGETKSDPESRAVDTKIESTDLRDAVLRGDLVNVKQLLKNDPGAAEKQDGYGRTPLHFAALGDNLEIVQLLLGKLPKNLEHRDHNGRTGLHFAALGGNLKTVELLFEKEPEKVKEPDMFGATPLHYAALGPNLNSLNMLNIYLPVGKSQPINYSSLQLLVSKGTDLLLDEVLSDPAAPHIQRRFEEHRSSYGGKFDTFAWTNCEKHSMGSLAHYGEGHLEVFQYLLENREGSKDKFDDTLLHYAAYGGNLEIFKSALKVTTDVNVKDRRIGKPLHYAALGGNLEIFKELFDQGPYECESDRTGRTLLHYAALGGNSKVFKLIPQNVTGVKLEDQNGSTVLHYAALGGNLDIVKLLLCKGASADAKNYLGRLPLHYAVSSGSSDVIDCLRSRSYGYHRDTFQTTAIDPIVDLLLQTKRRKQMQECQSEEKLLGAKTVLETELDETSSTPATTSGNSACSSSLVSETTGSLLEHGDDISSPLSKMSIQSSANDPEVVQSSLSEDCLHEERKEEQMPKDDTAKSQRQGTVMKAELTTIEFQEDVNFELLEVEQPLLMNNFEDELKEGSLYLLPKRICVNILDQEKIRGPATVSVNVGSIVQQMEDRGEVVDVGLFFILQKSERDVTDITNNSQPKLDNQLLVYTCDNFSDHVVGAAKRRSLKERAILFIKGLFRAHLCPAANFMHNEAALRLSLFCHSKCAKILRNPHRCINRYPSEVHEDSAIEIELPRFLGNNPVPPQPVDRKAWDKEGIVIEHKEDQWNGETISFNMHVFSSLKGKRTLLFPRIVQIGKELESYPRTGRGLVVIINIINFKRSPKRKRRGSDLDETKLKRLFEETIRGDYDVLCGGRYRDVTSEGIETIIADVQSRLADKEKNYNQLFWFMFSHGSKEGIKMHDKETVKQESIIEKFKGTEVEKMKDFPKVFVFQACRGTDVNYPVGIDGDDGVELEQVDEDSTKHIPPLIPPNAHVMTAYATTPGHVAYRYDFEGSAFISAFCDVVEQHYLTRHLAEILTEVQRHVSQKNRPRENQPYAVQMPMHISTFTKTMYFHR